jgi:hypothetical protein
MAGELNILKIVKEHLVRTGFQKKHNELVDVVIFDVENDGNGNLIFYTNIDTIVVPLDSPSSIGDLTDVDVTGATTGMALIYNGSDWVATDIVTSSELEYIRPDFSTRPELSDVGNITSVIDALDKILYPYEFPSFSAFTINSKPNTLELGQDLIPFGGQNVTFSWGVNNLSNVSTTIGYDIRDVGNAVDLTTNILPRTTTSSLVNVPTQIVKTNNGATHQFRITGTNTQAGTFTRNKTYTWRPRRFWGTSSNGGALNSAEILALPSSNTGGSELSGSRLKKWSIDGNGEYIHYYWEASLGDTPQILVGNLPNSAWTKHTVSFTNAYGHVTNYIGYVTNTIQFGTNILIEFT